MMCRGADAAKKAVSEAQPGVQGCFSDVSPINIGVYAKDTKRCQVGIYGVYPVCIRCAYGEAPLWAARSRLAKRDQGGFAARSNTVRTTNYRSL